MKHDLIKVFLEQRINHYIYQQQETFLEEINQALLETFKFKVIIDPLVEIDWYKVSIDDKYAFKFKVENILSFLY